MTRLNILDSSSSGESTAFSSSAVFSLGFAGKGPRKDVNQPYGNIACGVTEAWESPLALSNRVKFIQSQN